MGCRGLPATLLHLSQLSSRVALLGSRTCAKIIGRQLYSCGCLGALLLMLL
jgi:hypothetical protein